jgi:hypothetical protein
MPHMIQWEAVLGALGFTFIGASLFTYVVAHYWLQFRKLDQHKSRQSVAEANSIDERLKRIEQIVDATAVEVERIAEAQRFQSRLLADKAQEPVR